MHQTRRATATLQIEGDFQSELRATAELEPAAEQSHSKVIEERSTACQSSASSRREPVDIDESSASSDDDVEDAASRSGGSDVHEDEARAENSQADSVLDVTSLSNASSQPVSQHLAGAYDAEEFDSDGGASRSDSPDARQASRARIHADSVHAGQTAQQADDFAAFEDATSELGDDEDNHAKDMAVNSSDSDDDSETSSQRSPTPISDRPGSESALSNR